MQENVQLAEQVLRQVKRLGCTGQVEVLPLGTGTAVHSWDHMEFRSTGTNVLWDPMQFFFPSVWVEQKESTIN